VNRIKGRRLKKYVFSYNIETVPDQYLGDMKHVTKIDINLYSLDLEMPSATYNWAWVFNFQKAPMLKGRYRESFANFINFLENAETDTIKSPKLVGDLFLTDGEGTLIGFANSKKQVNDELLIPHKVNREEIATIGKFAFAENEQIQTVYVSEGIKLLDESSFYYCKNLKDIYLPQSLERIGPWALYGPSELTIHYAGTKRQWDNLTKGVKSLQLECCKVLFDETF